jgi:hypothetical protein
MATRIIPATASTILAPTTIAMTGDRLLVWYITTDARTPNKQLTVTVIRMARSTLRGAHGEIGTVN